MATIADAGVMHDDGPDRSQHTNGNDDPFMEADETAQQPYFHRFSSRLELDAADLGAASSPSQVKRVLEAHLLETERRLQDTHKLGTSLLQQQSELQEKLQEVEQQQDEAEISPELRQRLVYIGREHDDVSREIARSLLAPKPRAVSGEEKDESTLFTSQATGSPTKISAPNRRSRNQPINRAGDLQFAADISTSLLAQVRQLQTAVAERDEALKTANSDRSKLEQDVQIFVQRLRSHDENEQKYKDENWNLEAQNHELLSAQREAVDKEKKLNATAAIANAERVRLLSEVDEHKLAHSKAVEEHEAAKKAHETELHGLKRDFDSADLERSSLQGKIEKLTAQNEELAMMMASKFRSQSPQKHLELGEEDDDLSKDLSTPDQSPPPSPTKATPRHGGLESETLKSSLHHAHRMIQNLKSNIHREKTEKIELKRMLQDARDELEQRRSDNNFGSGAKKQKPKSEVFKKPARPDMLGGSRRARTDVEMEDEGWEDQMNDSPRQSGAIKYRPATTNTDLSDAYQTAHETESNFETADERTMTESEAFETGAESLAGDSTDDLTETESTAPHSRDRSSVRHNRPSITFRSAGNRDSYLSTASTSAGEEDEEMRTPNQPQPYRYKLRNGRSSSSRQTQIYEGTPDTVRTQVTAFDSPATTADGRSPPGVEQSLFAELEGINDMGSNFSTPARLGSMDVESTPSVSETPSKSITSIASQAPTARGSKLAAVKPAMVDSSTMTEPWQPEPASLQEVTLAGHSNATAYLPTEAIASDTRAVSIGDFPLPPSVQTSPVRHVDSGTQYTPQRSSSSEIQTTPQHIHETQDRYTPSKAVQESPIRGGNTFITPPRTVWDAEHESEIGSPEQTWSTTKEAVRPSLPYSGMTSQDLIPQSPILPAIEPPMVLDFSSILSQQTHPIAPPPSLPPTIPLPAIPSANKQKHSDTDRTVAGAATGGLLAGAAAAVGLSSWSKKESNVPKVAEDSTSSPATDNLRGTNTPLQDISGNATLGKKTSNKDVATSSGVPVPVSSNDSSSQTTLTSDEIDKVLQAKRTSPVTPDPLPSILEPIYADTSKPLPRSPDLSEPLVSGTSSSAPTSPPLRPSSASSLRPSTANKNHPPLPSNYKTNIARANSLLQSNVTKRESNTPIVGSVMGPPLMPASAMRRPKTPADSTRSPSRENATPRVARSTRNRGDTNPESHVSRRSSVSSFASEIDERFNIRTGFAGNGYEPAAGTDPRMIQAITQTMIGEYLWKYTRKPGSKEMSSTRHRRYFWVHPYTKTLYWSRTDPSLPGSKEGASKSVPIESIRVVSDDNPMPPGLHRKSLEITTPSRKLKFTATTGQRHETWFNALSYLLLRGEPPDTVGAYSTGGNEITRDDLDEFRVSGHNPQLIPAGRTSMSSYNSRTTAGTGKRISGTTGANQRQGLPPNVMSNAVNHSLRHQGSVTQNTSVPPSTATSGRVSRAEESHNTDKDRTIRASSMSRVSRMLGSLTGRPSKHSVSEQAGPQQAGSSRGPSRQSNSIYDASVISATRDSAEETRQEMLNQEPGSSGRGAGLENVRACCDGKHDVSTLDHAHRTDGSRALSSMSDRINRSISKRV